MTFTRSVAPPFLFLLVPGMSVVTPLSSFHLPDLPPSSRVFMSLVFRAPTLWRLSSTPLSISCGICVSSGTIYLLDCNPLLWCQCYCLPLRPSIFYLPCPLFWCLCPPSPIIIFIEPTSLALHWRCPPCYPPPLHFSQYLLSQTLCDPLDTYCLFSVASAEFAWKLVKVICQFWMKHASFLSYPILSFQVFHCCYFLMQNQTDDPSHSHHQLSFYWCYLIAARTPLNEEDKGLISYHLLCDFWWHHLLL